MSAVSPRPPLSARGAYAMLTSVMMLWASGVIVARAVHDVIPPITFSFSRWAVAVLVLTPFAARQLRLQWRVIRVRLVYFGLLGLFMAGGSTLLVWSVNYTTATNAAMVSASQPTVTAVIAWIILRERLRPMQIAGIAAAAAGILVMVARMDLSVIVDLSFNPGDLLVLLAVTFYALYSVNLHRWVAGLSPLLMLYMTALGGMSVLLPFCLVEMTVVSEFEPTPVALGAIVFMALVPTMLATTMWNVSVGVVGPNRAAVFINLLPVFGTLMAVALLGEQLRFFHLVGGLLVCAGITLVVRPGRAVPPDTGRAS